MIEKDANRSDPADLRRQAEELLREKLADVTAIPPEEAGRLLHELQVHQIELEMQNEELRRAQKELAASRVKYFDLYDMAPVGYFTVSEKGLILEANLTADILLGVVQRALAKEFLTRFILTEDQDIYYRHSKQLFKTGEPHACELRMVKKDGIPFWARLDAIVAQGVDGAPVCRVVLKDITERKRVEEETRVLAKFPSENPDPVIRIAADGALLYINKSGSRKLSEWNLQAGKIVPPMLRDAVSRALNHGSRQIIDLEHNEKVYSFTVAPISDVGYANLYGRDITERKWAEEIVRKETSLRNVLLENLPCIALVLKKQTREIVACNELGKKNGAVVGKSCYDALAVPDTSCPFCLAPELWETNESKQVEVEYMGRFWHGIWVPFSDDLYVHYIFDITDRKRAEIEKEKLQAQLRQAMKMETVGRLAGGVAHDFNNLLTVITGYSELLLQKIGKESPMHGEVKEIMRAGERAASLTQQLLAFSRKQIIEPKIMDLNLLTADVGKMLVRLIGENIHLKMVPGKDLGLVKVDPGQFDQVLINLAVNARDAMPDGGTLLIETANVELDEEYCAGRPYQIRPGRFVRLSVSDTGHGMAEETRQQIFEPFFTTKEKGKGTGLGLSMVYGAVKQSGGSIEAYSEVGIGTTFKIYLPRVEGDAMKPGEDERSAVFPEGTETVLVVEDDDTVRNLGVRILERFGYKVMQARNGDEAISLAAGYGERIDLLLTDVVMPGMNVSEMATQLVLHHPEMKVLFTSGYTDDAISRHGVLDEGISFIGKPYTPIPLARKVREVLDGK